MDEMYVKTMTGKKYKIRFMGATVIGTTAVLYIELIGYTMMDVVSVFSDSHETSFLEAYVDDEPAKQFRGYTQMIEAIVLADSGNLRIALTAPMDSIGEV